jgi:hypothetical protein
MPTDLLDLVEPCLWPSFVIDLFAGGADKNELFQTRSEFWDRLDVLHGVTTRGAY